MVDMIDSRHISGRYFDSIQQNIRNIPAKGKPTAVTKDPKYASLPSSPEFWQGNKGIFGKISTGIEAMRNNSLRRMFVLDRQIEGKLNKEQLENLKKLSKLPCRPDWCMSAYVAHLQSFRYDEKASMLLDDIINSDVRLLDSPYYIEDFMKLSDDDFKIARSVFRKITDSKKADFRDKLDWLYRAGEKLSAAKNVEQCAQEIRTEFGIYVEHKANQ